jgi:hypothetical protein
MKNGRPAPGQRVTNDVTVQTFSSTATSIAGTAEGLRKSLQELEADLKKDVEGKKEYETFKKQLEIKKADLQRRVGGCAAACGHHVCRIRRQKRVGGAQFRAHVRRSSRNVCTFVPQRSTRHGWPR